MNAYAEGSAGLARRQLAALVLGVALGLAGPAARGGEVVDLFGAAGDVPAETGETRERDRAAPPEAGRSPPKADPETAAGEEKVYAIALTEAPDGRGRFGGVEGEAGPEGDRFGIEGLGLFEPVDLLLEHRGDTGILQMEIFKYRFDDALERRQATPAEPALLGLRTQGGLRIRVRGEGDAPVPYRLVVRVGPEEADRIVTPFVAEGGEADTPRSPPSAGDRP